MRNLALCTFCNRAKEPAADGAVKAAIPATAEDRDAQEDTAACLMEIRKSVDWGSRTFSFMDAMIKHFILKESSRHPSSFKCFYSY